MQIELKSLLHYSTAICGMLAALQGITVGLLHKSWDCTKLDQPLPLPDTSTSNTQVPLLSHGAPYGAVLTGFELFRAQTRGRDQFIMDDHVFEGQAFIKALWDTLSSLANSLEDQPVSENIRHDGGSVVPLQFPVASYHMNRHSAHVGDDGDEVKEEEQEKAWKKQRRRERKEAKEYAESDDPLIRLFRSIENNTYNPYGRFDWDH